LRPVKIFIGAVTLARHVNLAPLPLLFIGLLQINVNCWN